MKAVMFEDVSRMLRLVDLSIVNAIAGAVNFYVEYGESDLLDSLLALHVEHDDITEKQCIDVKNYALRIRGV